MRGTPPVHNTTAAAAMGDSGLTHWTSPLPYLFGGLALMLGLIALALVILACSYRKPPSSSSSSTSGNADDKPATPAHMLQPEMEPKIVVIMAGDHNPTFLANPRLACSHHTL